MNDVKRLPTDSFFLTARIHWPRPLEFGELADPDTGEMKIVPPNTQIILHKTKDAEDIKKLKARVAAVCRLKNPDKEEDGEFEGQGRLLEPSKMLFADGDFLKGKEYKDHFRFHAKTQQVTGQGKCYPYVADPFDPNKRITDPGGAHGLYAGCYATLSLSLWFVTKFPRVCCELHGIQFLKDGERLIGGQLSDEEVVSGFQTKDRPTIADESDWGDNTKTEATAASVADAADDW